MISIIRAGYSPELPSGSRTIDALNNEFSEAPPISCIRRMIIIKKIDPEEFEDGVNDMAKEEDFDLSPEELDKLEAEVPAEADEMTDAELGPDEDLDEDGTDPEPIGKKEGDESGEKEESGDGDMTEEELDALENEIPPEADELSDEEAAEPDPDLDDEAAEDDSEDLADKKEDKKEKEDDEDDLDESVIIKEKDTVNDYL